ncbi:MAG TPA: CopG family transcriptional regulator [Candidatus Dormibacteraeota bacterium]|nr:CopG family transcriptional regulator [Candidatus Dormibacteraeota bacterium]
MRTRTGQRVTKEMVEALTREAEVGYQPRTLQPKRVGRPSLGRGISPRIQVRFDRRVHARLRKAATARGETVSGYVRALVEEHLRRARKPPLIRRATSGSRKSH